MDNHQEKNQQSSGISFSNVLIAKAGSVFMLLVFGWVSWEGISSRWEELSASPDITGDGRFTILDIPATAASLVLSVGDHYQAIMADTSFGPFLEMSADEPRIFWSVIFCLFTFGMSYQFVRILFAPMSTDPWDPSS